MPDLPPTRAEALALGLIYYFTGKPCKRGHIAKRYAPSGACMGCASEKNRRYYAANPEKLRERSRQWAKANPGKKREIARRYREANPEKLRENNRQWRAANPEKEREQSRRYCEANPEKKRESVRQWHAANRDKCNAISATRRARKINATPPWADMAAIRAIYAKCAHVTAETGIKHNVDHILPLKGRNVCGLHVETNLQILTASQNFRKGNRLPRERRCCPA